MKKIKILAAAQFFGFGPTSSLFMIVDTLQKQYPDHFEITILSNPHVETLRDEIKDCPSTKIIAFDQTQPFFDQLDQLVDKEQFDLILSSYEASVIYYGWYKNIKTVHFDGLYQFWEIDDIRLNAQKYHSELSTIKHSQDISALEEWYFNLIKTVPHSLFFGCHAYATLNLVQKNNGVSKRIAESKIFHSKPTVLVSNIIKSVHDTPVPFSSRKDFLVMIGGSLNPIIPLKDNCKYALWCIKLIAHISRFLSGSQDRFTILLHPEVYNNLPSIPEHEQIEIRKAIPQQQYFKLLRQAKGSFLPPSNLSAPESLYFHTPVFFIPEQNGGQPPLYSSFIKYGFPRGYDYTITGNLHDGNVVYGEHDHEEMYRAIERYITELTSNNTDRVAQNIQGVLENESSYNQLVTDQYNAVESLQGDFTGTNQIVDYIYSVATSEVW